MAGITEPLVVIGLFSTAIGLFFTVYELKRSAKIAISNTETEILRDFDKWTTKFKDASSDEKEFFYLKKVLNALEHLVKDVKRDVYPFNEYIKDFLPVTLKYFCEFENLYIKKREPLDAAQKYINTYHTSLLPVFDYYVKKSDAFLKAEGKEKERTLDNLKNFMKSEYREPDKSDKKELKIIKKRIK